MDNKIKIAIHHRNNSYSDYWIQYCRENDIDYKIVNCYSNDIIDQLIDCHGLMWHWSQDDHKAQLFARQLIISLERKGIKVFPDSCTCWHYDDKIGQKYLLESLEAPMIPTYIFYDREDAIVWLNNVTFPKVFKLRGGAGSANVKLVKTKKKARRFINISFGKGFSLRSRVANIKERFWVLKRDKSIFALTHFIKGIIRLFYPKINPRLYPRQKGYVYFQDFISNINHDIRVVIIGDKAFAMKRWNRRGDFRASGSGLKSYDYSDIDVDYIETCFHLNDKIKANSIAIDLLKDKGKIKIIEISYTFTTIIFPGYWNRNLIWKYQKVNVVNLMIENFINGINSELIHK